MSTPFHSILRPLPLPARACATRFISRRLTRRTRSTPGRLRHAARLVAARPRADRA